MSQEKNNQMLSYMGVSKLHALGFKGDGIKVMILDNLNDPEKHGEMVKYAESISLPSPTAIITLADNGDAAWNKAIAEKYDIVHISMTAFSRELSKKFVDGGGIVTASTGNRSQSATQNEHNEWDWVIDIGACYIDSNGIVQRDSVTKSNDYMDLTCFTPMKQRADGTWFTPIGTSFSSPFASGAIGCLLQYWKHIGYYYNQKIVRDYLLKNAVDILAEGYDSQSGFGQIKVGLMKKIELEIGGKAFVDGIEVPIDVPAQIIKGRTLVPARFLAENLGCKLQVTQEVGKPVSKVTIFKEI